MPTLTIGLDIAKNVFQIHGVDRHGKVVIQRKLRRSDVLKFFAKLESGLVGIEACHGSHFWARELTALGHTVRLLPTQYVKPFLIGGKNDANDAAAICAAVTRPGIHFVAIKSAEQQSLQSVHRMRQRLVLERTAKSNQIRSMFAEEGVIFPIGLPQLRKGGGAGQRPRFRHHHFTKTAWINVLEQLKALQQWLDELATEIAEIFKAMRPANGSLQFRELGRLLRLVTTGSETAVTQTPPPPRPPATDGSSKATTFNFARSASEPHREWIEQQVRLRRNAQAIYQDLVDQFAFTASYESVKRFARALRHIDPDQFDRLAFAPAE